MILNFKKIALIFSAIFTFTFVSLANENEIVEQVQDDDVIFMVVEKMPEFPGGQQALMRFLAENIRVPNVGDHPPTGRVILQFVVEIDGSITNIEILRSIDRNLDQEAVRVIESMPNWIPGEQRGVKVRVRFVLPVTFRLQ